MKIIVALFVCLTFTSYTAMSQCDVIHSLNFPYHKGLVMSLSGKNTYYDNFNFPRKTVDRMTHYSVTESNLGKNGTTAHFIVNLISDNDTITRNQPSDLSLNDKGMSWTWGPKNKVTQAILLPMQKGTSWTTIWDNSKEKARCITTDTIISLYLGKVHAFGVSITVPGTKDERFSYFQEFSEWYNVYLGKVAILFKQYGIEKETGRTFVFYTEESKLSYTNVSEDKIQQALSSCR